MVNLEDMIGTMVFSPSGNYIVGASERQNAEFQKKCQNKIDINLRDCVELTCVKEFVLTSDNYNDIMQVKGMPGSIFGDKFGYEMQKEITNYMKSYYDGETGKEDVENKSKLTLDGNFDFNSGWNFHFRMQHSRSSIET